MSLLVHLEGAISSSGSKKGQVEMGAAAGFLFCVMSRLVQIAFRFWFCGCSIGSFYAFLLLQRARIFGSASLTYASLAYVYVFGLPSRGEIATGERESESTDNDFFLSSWVFA